MFLKVWPPLRSASGEWNVRPRDCHYLQSPIPSCRGSLFLWEEVLLDFSCVTSKRWDLLLHVPLGLSWTPDSFWTTHLELAFLDVLETPHTQRDQNRTCCLPSPEAPMQRFLFQWSKNHPWHNYPSQNLKPDRLQLCPLLPSHPQNLRFCAEVDSKLASLFSLHLSHHFLVQWEPISRPLSELGHVCPSCLMGDLCSPSPLLPSQYLGPLLGEPLE